MAKRIPLSIVKSIPSLYYERFGYHDLNARLRELTLNVALFIEDQGFEATSPARQTCGICIKVCPIGLTLQHANFCREQEKGPICR